MRYVCINYHFQIMANAVLYIRVSTDEQAQKGYSQRNQEERLQKFCVSNKIEVIKTVYEDYSAKTFNRPAWSILLTSFNRNKSNRPDQILFTRWDRFSRNAADAYYMIEKLKNINIEATAIDQPLNLAIPENKIMLAIYLATSEVENDRRSLNIQQGIHKAKQEGRCTGLAPIGYKNITLIDGVKSIRPYEPEAAFVRNIFNELAKSEQSSQAIYNVAKIKGLKCSLNNFWLMIRNPIYCGKIVVPEYEQQKRHLVKGLHQGLITEQLFEQVQDVLNNNMRQQIRSVLDPFLPLRGFLQCPLCLKTLTGSASKGKTNYYYYYHCFGGCKFRVRADLLNMLFNKELELLVSLKYYTSLFEVILKDVYNKQFGAAVTDQSEIFKNIKKTFERIAKAKELLLTGEIDHEDYLAIQADCENRINKMGTDLKEAASLISKVNQTLNSATNSFSNLALTFKNADINLKRKLISLICESRIKYNNGHFVPLFNESIKTICDLDQNTIINSKENLLKISSSKDSILPRSIDVTAVINVSTKINQEPDNQQIKLFLEKLAELII